MVKEIVGCLKVSGSLESNEIAVNKYKKFADLVLKKQPSLY